MHREKLTFNFIYCHIFQTKISPKTKKSSTSLENIAADQAALNHGPAPLSSHLPASSGLLSTLLAAPTKNLKHVAETINQVRLSWDYYGSLVIIGDHQDNQRLLGITRGYYGSPEIVMYHQGLDRIIRDQQWTIRNYQGSLGILNRDYYYSHMTFKFSV